MLTGPGGKWAPEQAYQPIPISFRTLKGVCQTAGQSAPGGGTGADRGLSQVPLSTCDFPPPARVVFTETETKPRSRSQCSLGLSAGLAPSL